MRPKAPPRLRSSTAAPSRNIPAIAVQAAEEGVAHLHPHAGRHTTLVKHPGVVDDADLVGSDGREPPERGQLRRGGGLVGAGVATPAAPRC
jgi:hypothetical protein